MSDSTRRAYLTGVLDQLQEAIRRKDTDAGEAILRDAYSRDPEAADVILDRLIAAGLRRATGRA
jgi:hypothetical protein